MIMTDVHEIFRNLRQVNAFTRVDGTHILDLYLGTDGFSRKVLLLISDNQPNNLISTRIINVAIGLRNDNRWALSFTLCDDSYNDMFMLFCSDIIDTSRTVRDKADGTGFVCERYKKWQRLLAASKSDLLSFSQLKGLLGEMVFLRDSLVPKYGITAAVDSWMGPDMADQDFVIDNTWYEIKTVSSGATEIHISSVEQLDCENPGELVVIYADKTSKSNQHAQTPNSVYNSLIDMMPDSELKYRFSKRLMHIGYYPRPEYDSDSCTFEVKGRNIYTVTPEFPCLRRNTIPVTVNDVTYTLSLAAINLYRKE